MSKQRIPPAPGKEERFRRLVYAMVRRVPRGRVATYGDIAAAVGRPGAARAVGRALATLPAPMARTVPWQRVVNAAGRISRRDPDAMALQSDLLEREGVRLRRGGRVDLALARWAVSGHARRRRFLDALRKESRAALRGLGAPNGGRGER